MPYKQPPGNRHQQLNVRQRQWLKLYTGRNSKLAGNATRCYKAVYGITNERSAQVLGNKLKNHPVIKSLLDDAEKKALAELQIDARYVLEQTVRLYDRAMGDEPVQLVDVRTDPKTGVDTVTVTETRSYDPATAHKALTAIGQHRDVQAFTQTVEHTHTHRLEQRLAARSKAIEGRAQVLDDPPQLQADPGAQVVTDPGADPASQVVSESPAAAPPGSRPAAAPPSDPHHCSAQQHAGGLDVDPAGGRADTKRVHAAGGQDDRRGANKQSAPERDGATADYYMDKST